MNTYNCEFCHKPIEDDNDYDVLSENETYKNDSAPAYIVHDRCKGIEKTKVLQEQGACVLILEETE